jgi:hypothetical protein
MKYIVVLLIVCIVFSSCTTLRPNESWENLLNKARRPITVVSVSSEIVPVSSVLFRDASGKFFTIYGSQFYGLKEGDMFY